MFRRSTLLALAITLTLLVPSVCPAAPLDAIPEDAVAVFRFRRPQALVKKTIAVAAKLDSDYEAKLTEAANLIGTYIGNPKVEGVDPNGDWYLALMDGRSGQTAVVYGLPYKDKEDAMKTAVGGGYRFVKHEKYLFYTLDDSVSQRIQARVNDEGKSISARIDRTPLSLINKADIGVFVNIRHLTDKYKPQIDVVSEELDKALADWKTIAPQVEGMDLSAVFQMYGDAAKILLQGVRDCEGYTATFDLNFQGTTIEQYLSVAAGSPTDLMLQTQKTSDLKELERLPADQVAYVAMEGDFAAITQWSYKFAAELLKDEAAKTAMQEVAAMQAEMTYGGYLMAFDVADPSQGALRTTVVTIAEPVDKLREVTRRIATLIPALSTAGVSQKVDFKTAAERIGAYTADVLTVSTQTDTSNVPPQLAELMEKSARAMYGPDGMTQRMVYLGDRVVTTMGGGQQAMEVAINAQARSPFLNDRGMSPVESTRKALAQKANLVALVDLPRLAARYSKVMAEIQPAEGEVARLKDLEFKPSYLGVSVTIGAGSIASTTYIPFEQAEGLNELMKPYVPYIQMFVPFGTAGPPPIEFQPKFGGGSREKGR